jgi:hypothetical protein
MLRDADFSAGDYLDPPPEYVEPYDQGTALFYLGYRGAGVKMVRHAAAINGRAVSRRTAAYMLGALGQKQSH